MLSRAEQMISVQGAVDSTFQLCFWRGGKIVFKLSHPTPGHPTVDFLYFVGKNNMLVYFSILIRQWSPLCPTWPLLRDKGTSKASVRVVGALQEDKAVTLASGSELYFSPYSFQTIIYAKNSQWVHIAFSLYYSEQIFFSHCLYAEQKLALSQPQRMKHSP